MPHENYAAATRYNDGLPRDGQRLHDVASASSAILYPLSGNGKLEIAATPPQELLPLTAQHVIWHAPLELWRRRQPSC